VLAKASARLKMTASEGAGQRNVGWPPGRKSTGSQSHSPSHSIYGDLMQRAPRICGCRLRIAHGERCPCERQRDAARKAKADAARPSASARGYDHRWTTYRTSFLNRHPRCFRCDAAATVVAHIKPVSQGGSFWDRTNHQALCRPCHSSAKQSADRAALKPR